MALDKVIDSAAFQADLKSIADSIRAKSGTSALFSSAAEMKAAVDAISTGGSAPVIRSLKVTQNGITTVPSGIDGYNPVEVAIPSDRKPEEEKTVNIDKNGTKHIYPSLGKVISKVTINTLTPEPKPEQEKTISIIENGNLNIIPDGGFTLSKVIINTNIPIPTFITIHTGSANPSNTIGENGDIYLQG